MLYLEVTKTGKNNVENRPINTAQDFRGSDPKRDAEKRTQIMYELKKYHIEHGECKMTPVAHRNILLLGGTHGGKSTLKSVLIDPTTVAEKLSLMSDPRGAMFESFNVVGEQIILNIIDTPGLSQLASLKTDVRGDQSILEIIKTCVKQEVTKLHVICFCISLRFGLTEEGIRSIQVLSDFLGKNISHNSCLIITHAERKSREECDRIRAELCNSPCFRSIVPLFGLGVFFSGSLDSDHYRLGIEAAVHYHFRTVLKYRSTLIELFKRDIAPISIDNMFGGQRVT